MSKLADWVVKPVVGALAVGAMWGAWYLFNAIYYRVPQLESQLANHASQIASLKVSLYTLMQKTGNPPDEKQLKELLTSIQDVGKASAQLIKQVDVVKGTGQMQLTGWAGIGLAAGLEKETSLAEFPLKQKNEISSFISKSIIYPSARWEASERKLTVSYGDSVLAVTPKKGVSEEALKEWAKALSSLQGDALAVSKTAPAPQKETIPESKNMPDVSK